MYDEFGNYLGPDLSDEEEDEEEEHFQQQQQQQLQQDEEDQEMDDDEDVEMQEDNVRTSTALSRIGGNNHSNPSHLKALRFLEISFFWCSTWKKDSLL